MGDPIKSKKLYARPAHPWQAQRIEEEHELSKEYGLKNRKEIWRLLYLLRKFKYQAKGIEKKPEEQIEKEQKLLVEKLVKLKLIQKTAKMEDILGITIKDLMERRLQTMVYRQNLAKTIKQARQFIIHGHIMVNGKKMTVPSYLVKDEDEAKITFLPHSQLSNPDHPERIVKKVENTKIVPKENKEEKKEFKAKFKDKKNFKEKSFAKKEKPKEKKEQKETK